MRKANKTPGIDIERDEIPKQDGHLGNWPNATHCLSLTMKRVKQEERKSFRVLAIEKQTSFYTVCDEG